MELNLLKKYPLSFTPVWVFIFHFGLLYLVYQLLVLGSFIQSMDIYHFKQWDAHWYASIAKYGYQIDFTKQSNSGFFPLFPYEWKLLWKITGAGVTGVCLSNVTIFFAGMLILKKAFNFSWALFLVFVSIPGNIFMYVPYTEATFFFFSALILAGLKTNNTAMLMVGLFFASLTKPTATFFIPAIMAMEIIHFSNFKLFIKRVIGFSLIPLISVLIVVVIQYIQTGVWFAYFIAQSNFWHRTLQLPEFPITTWGGPRNLWIDALAVFFGLLATCILIGLFFKRLLKKNLAEIDRSTIFSLTYLSLTLFSVLFFNGKDALGGTSLMGANRYILANPFILMLLLLISQNEKIQKNYVFVYASLALALVFLLKLYGGEFIAYKPADQWLYRFLVFISIGMYALIIKRFNERFMFTIYLVNVFSQIILLQQFANGLWVG